MPSLERHYRHAVAAWKITFQHHATNVDFSRKLVNLYQRYMVDSLSQAQIAASDINKTAIDSLSSRVDYVITLLLIMSTTKRFCNDSLFGLFFTGASGVGKTTNLAIINASRRFHEVPVGRNVSLTGAFQSLSNTNTILR